jgi:hypothetical protein
MFDAINKAAGIGHRHGLKSGGMHFSPSFGVRNGFIKDPNWPPANISDDQGAAANRRQLRVKCGFMIRIAGANLVPTFGDISAGGAKFTLDAAIGNEVEVLAGDFVAKAEVLQVLKGAGKFVYRVKFTDANAGAQVFESAFWS